MRNLRRINYLNLSLYGLFICFNLVEIIWNGYHYSLGNRLIISPRMNFIDAFMQSELWMHTIFNRIATVTLVFFLLLCNWLVKKNDLGKSFHFLLVLLSFFPVANYFLYYIIWRKLNQNLFKYFGRSYRESDRIIVAVWILELFYSVGSILIWIVEFYSKSPEFVSAIAYLKDLDPLAHSIYLLAISVLYLMYYLDLNKGIMKINSGVHDLISNDLID